MNYVKKILYTLPPLIFFIIVTTNILSFVGIGIDSYAIYLIWIIAVEILYIVLPSEHPSFKF